MTGQWIAPLLECGIGTALEALRARVVENGFAQEVMNAEAMRQRAASFPEDRRALLVRVLQDQSGPDYSPVQQEHLQRLARPDSVTVVAGQQLVSALGPLYVHSKIAETVALAAHWTARGVPTVPVFWMASEDHDIDEVRRIFWRGKAVAAWDRPRETIRSGLVEALPVAEAIKAWLDTSPVPEAVRVAAERSEEAYRTSTNLAEATRRLLAHYHPEVLVLDASDPRLKAAAGDLWQDEIANQTLFRSAEEASRPWAGAEPPVPFRQSALFALDRQGKRLRIDRDAQGSWVRSDGIAMGSDRDVAAWASSNPQEVSPNALLRLAYQEWILPNAAYTGGAAEVAYAQQLAPYWRNSGSPHALWRLRHSSAWFPAKAQKASQHFSADFFRGSWNPQQVRQSILEEAGAPNRNDLVLTEEFKAKITDRYGMPGLEQSVAAWVKRIGNEEGKMLERLRREIARGQATRLNHLATLSDNLLPSGTLQERIWTHFDLAECAGDDAISQYLKAFSSQQNWDDAGWWEFR